jgi:hypothetical protein
MRNDIVVWRNNTRKRRRKLPQSALRFRRRSGLSPRFFSIRGDRAFRRPVFLADVALWADNGRTGPWSLVLGLMALLPLVVGRRPARPPPAPHTTTPQFAQTAPSLALKRPLLSAFLLAVALGIMARGSSSSYEKKQRACEGRTPSAIKDECGSWPLSESRFLLSPL